MKATERTANCALDSRLSAHYVQSARYGISPVLSGFLDHFWMSAWDLRGGEPYVHESLPDPCIHLVIEAGNSRIVGVSSGKVSHRLEGVGRLFGVCFKPGGFYSYLEAPVVQITNNTLPLRSVFGDEGDALAEAILAEPEDPMRVLIAEAFFAARLPAPDTNLALLNRMIDCIIADRGIAKVGDLASRFSVHQRTLQRLFNRYVGIHPKSVIHRYRLQDAAEQLARRTQDRQPTSLPEVALSLGYADQSHFTNDFRTVVGSTPAAFSQRLVQQNAQPTATASST